ncbi:MAG: hypothetical protein QW057_01470 [Candidatus Bathyarchaeia archaeon]
MKKAELEEVANDLFKLARRRLSYDYTGLLIYESLDSVGQDEEIGDEEAAERLFAAYDRYMCSLDPASQRALQILKYCLLLDLADLRPKTAGPEKRAALKTRLTTLHVSYSKEPAE